MLFLSHLHCGSIFLEDIVNVADNVVGVAYLLEVPVPVAGDIGIGRILIVGLDGDNGAGGRAAAICVVTSGLGSDEPIHVSFFLDIFYPAVIQRVAKSQHICSGRILAFAVVLHIHVVFIVGCVGIQIQIASLECHNDSRRKNKIYNFHINASLVIRNPH